jgi:hypothetical protein
MRKQITMPKCELCGKTLSKIGCKRCRKCMNIGRKASKKTKDKIKNALKNYFDNHTVWNKNKDCKNYNWGRKKILPKNYCLICGEEIQGKKYCLKCYNIYRFGKESSNWQGGISLNPYPPEWTEKLRESIRTRDNHKCQCCGMTQEENCRALDIHHIDYDKDNCNESNLITLCHQCHLKSNFNRDYWYAFYSSKNKIKGEKEHEYQIN